MLTLNEIIDNGFEGQHFITGLGQHLRDLLVSQDKETVKLLDTSANIRNQYLQQAAQCSQGFLLKALDLCNEVDINYRNSNNKRLHLEIALMQLCILSNPEAASLSKPAAAPVPLKKTEPVLPVATPVKETPAAKVEEPALLLQPQTVVSPPQASPFVPAAPATPVAPDSGQPVKSPPVTPSQSYTGLNLGNLMSSGLKSVVNEPAEDVKALEDELPEQSEAFTQADLENIWKEMATTIAVKLPNLYTTLTCRVPVLHENNRIVVTVDNRIQDGEVFNNRAAITLFLRKRLKNTSISIETVISDKPIEERRPYTDTEKFEAMARNAPEIRNLKDQLNLDIEM